MMMRKILTIGTILIMMTVLINVVYGLSLNSIHCSTYYTDNAIIAKSDHIEAICYVGSQKICEKICMIATQVYNFYKSHDLKLPKTIKIILRWLYATGAGACAYPDKIVITNVGSITPYTIAHEMCHIVQFQYNPHATWSDNWVIESLADACADAFVCGTDHPLETFINVVRGVAPCTVSDPDVHICWNGFGHTYTNDMMFYIYLAFHQDWGKIIPEILNGTISPWDIWIFYISHIATLPAIKTINTWYSGCAYYYNTTRTLTIHIRNIILPGATRFIIVKHIGAKCRINVKNSTDMYFIVKNRTNITIIAIIFKQPFIGQIRIPIECRKVKSIEVSPTMTKKIREIEEITEKILTVILYVIHILF